MVHPTSPEQKTGIDKIQHMVRHTKQAIEGRGRIDYIKKLEVAKGSRWKKTRGKRLKAGENKKIQKTKKNGKWKEQEACDRR